MQTTEVARDEEGGRHTSGLNVIFVVHDIVEGAYDHSVYICKRHYVSWEIQTLRNDGTTRRCMVTTGILFRCAADRS